MVIMIFRHNRKFKQPLPEDVLVSLARKNFSDETMKKVKWVTTMYIAWRQYRHSLGLDCDLDDVSTINKESLIFALCQFVSEVKKVDGTDFPARTLYDIIICVQFHLETLGFTWRLVSDDVFSEVRFTLDNLMKKRTSEGVGVAVRKA